MPILGDEKRPVVKRHNAMCRTTAARRAHRSKSPDCRCAPLEMGTDHGLPVHSHQRASSLPGMNSVRRPGLSELTPKPSRSKNGTRSATDAEAFQRLRFVRIIGHHARRSDAHSTQHRSADSQSRVVQPHSPVCDPFQPRRLQSPVASKVRVLLSKPSHRPSWRG